ncbi:DNA-directed RNA polymerase subunit alpha C-terminal domain-containing protein [Neobacillus sp. NPDC093127]|uniref:DNA-directed RNA polymerase subunit alpha C-terminal domain-containing protein n=1 Tax=Neobacillus sp. NPDC093127 TaxID=3364296 RepID=UPI00381923CF
MYENKIGLWVKKKGRVQKQLAEKCGVSQQTFSSWVKNQTHPGLTQAAILSRELNLDIGDLVGEVEEKKDLRKMFIDELEYSQRVFTILKRNGINTVGDLIDYDLGNLRKAGPKAIHEVEVKLEKIRKEIEGDEK